MKQPILLTILAMTALLACQTGKKEALTAVRKDLVQGVYASGKVFPLQQVKLHPKVNGYVREVLVQPGDSVQAGQTLLVIEHEQSQYNIENARNQLQYSQQNVREQTSLLQAAQQDKQSAWERYQLDSLNYTRLKNLWQDGIGTRQNLDQANTQQKLSWQQWKKTQANYQNLSDRLQTEFRQAKNQVAQQQQSASDFTIKAPFASRIYNINTEVGQYVSPSNWIFDIGNPTAFEAKIDIDESDIGWVAVGQVVLLTSDAWPQDTLRGTIQRIYPSVVAGNKTSTAIVQMPPHKKYISGMAVESNIIVQEKRHILVIPRVYLDKQQQVTLINGDKRKIKTGIMDLNFVEVLEGLDANTQIIKPK
jgi:multidrug efflux pump subunit AcrA (membrane-fusion protein)